MSEHSLGFAARLGLAIKVFFDGAYAYSLTAAAESPAEAPGQLPAPAEAAAEETQAEEAQPPDHGPGALHLMALLQREGRLIDFLHEDVSSFSDEEVGGAARVIHQGCGKVLAQYFAIEPLRKETEGGPISVEAGFNPDEFRLTGEVQGEPPYLGSLAHPGWRALEVKLPEVQQDHDATIIAPAEVEL